MKGGIIFVLSLFSCSIAQAKAACVPDKTSFVWASPCQGQTFTNRVAVNSVAATQNGVPLDTLGGFNLSKVIDLAVSIADQYGQVQSPLLDLGVKQYAKFLGKCQWINVPGAALLSNLNSCDFVDNCHLQNNPDTLKASLDVKALLGGLISVITVGDYYGVSLTFKDAKTPLMCVYAQDIIISK